jgi:hypothetical protein
VISEVGLGAPALAPAAAAVVAAAPGVGAPDAAGAAAARAAAIEGTCGLAAAAPAASGAPTPGAEATTAAAAGAKAGAPKPTSEITPAASPSGRGAGGGTPPLTPRSLLEFVFSRSAALSGARDRLQARGLRPVQAAAAVAAAALLLYSAYAERRQLVARLRNSVAAAATGLAQLAGMAVGFSPSPMATAPQWRRP